MNSIKMNTINIYTRLLKNKNIYTIKFYTIKFNILFYLNIPYVLSNKKNHRLYFKILRYFLIENGFKFLLFKNWQKFSIKYNLISKLLI